MSSETKRNRWGAEHETICNVAQNHLLLFRSVQSQGTARGPRLQPKCCWPGPPAQVDRPTQRPLQLAHRLARVVGHAGVDHAALPLEVGQVREGRSWRTTTSPCLTRATSAHPLLHWGKVLPALNARALVRVAINMHGCGELHPFSSGLRRAAAGGCRWQPTTFRRASRPPSAAAPPAEAPIRRPHLETTPL